MIDKSEVKIKQNKFRWAIAFAVLAVILAAFALSAYRMLGKEAADMTEAYIDELAVHDAKTITDYVSVRWDTMESICKSFKMRDIQSLYDVLDELHAEAYIKSVDHINFIDEQGRLYTDMRVIYEANDNDFNALFSGNSRRFATVYESDGHYYSNNFEYMLYGINISDDPIEVPNSDVKLVGLIILNDISNIRKNLTIGCCDGRGATGIIDSNGMYIVNSGIGADDGEYLSFYDMLNGIGESIVGTNAESIAESVRNGKSVRFCYRSNDKKQIYVTVGKIDGTDWSYVTGLEKSVFADCTKKLVKATAIVLSMLFASLALFFVLLYFGTKKRNKQSLNNENNENVETIKEEENAEMPS